MAFTPVFLEQIHKEADDSLHQDSMFDEFGIFTNEWCFTCMFSGTQALLRQRSILFMAMTTRAILRSGRLEIPPALFWMAI